MNFSLRTRIILVGVPTKNPDSFSNVRCADISRPEHAPFRIEPDLGQRSKNSIQPPSNERWAVFHEAVARSNFAKDAMHVPPEAASLSVDAGSTACGANVLAGESAGNNVDASSPFGAIKLRDVIVNLHVGR
jgi:hypothetical protein